MLLVVWGAIACNSQPSAIRSSSVPDPSPTSRSIQYERHLLPHGEMHTVLIPLEQYHVQPVIFSEMQTVANVAPQSAIAVLNGGFFDPANGETTSYGVVDGILVADPRTNQRLMENSDLQSYLEQILNRSEFRRYQCEEQVEYAIARHTAAVPANCHLVDALGAGPRLLPALTLAEEGFLEIRDGEVVRDVLGSQQRNARSAIGIRGDRTLVWVMAAQLANSPESGASLAELAAFMRGLGVTDALNLDGGSSASLCYQQECFWGKLNAEGDRIQRPVKSVLQVRELPN